jgi:hypothetical protein
MSAPKLEYPYLVEELRLAGPPPSEELRERVRALAAAQPRRRRRWPLLAAALAPAAAVAAAFAIGGLDAARDGGPVAGQGDAVVASRETAPSDSAFESYDTAGEGTTALQRVAGGAVRAPLPASRTRAQEYRADMVVHVDTLLALSRATSSAMQSTRDLGGYLVSATQDSGADGRGYSALVVRVPTQAVQRAIVRFASLGVILEQNVQVRDLQAQLDALFREAQATRARIAKLEAQLAATPAGSARDRLEAQLASAKRRLEDLTGRSGAVKQRASFAKISLTLTTEETAAIAPPPAEPGRLERAWDRSLDILVGEAVVVLYAVLVAGPFVLLAALAWLAARATRRRGREALLERS